MGEVVPLIERAEQPRDEGEQKSRDAAEVRREREHGNGRQPKTPPDWVQAGAEIGQASRRGPGRDDEKNPAIFHIGNATRRLSPSTLGRKCLNATERSMLHNLPARLLFTQS